MLSKGGIVFVHGSSGHPFEAWASNQQIGDELAGGPPSLLKSLRSIIKPKAPPSKGSSTPDAVSSQTQQVYWPRDYLAEDTPQVPVWTYGYNADVISGLFQANNKNSASRHGRDLKIRLERKVENEVTLNM